MKRMISLAVVLGLALIPAAEGQANQEEPGTVSLDVTDAHLEDILKLLSRQSGMNFVASEATRDRTVTLYLDQVGVDHAIQTILSANHLALRRMPGNNLFVVIESGEPRIGTITKVFRLKYARVIPTTGETFTTFGNSGSLIQPLFEDESGSGTSSDSASSSSSGAGGTGGEAGAAGGGAGGGLAGGATGTGEGEKGGVVNILRQLVTEHGSVIPDPRTNSIIVNDVPERMDMLAATIAQLDTPTKQIFIEAEILEVGVDTLRRIGIEYGLSSGQLASFDGPVRNTLFPFSQGLFDGATKTSTLGTLTFSDSDVLLKLLATDVDTRFLARPRLLTLSNEVAEIRIVEEPVTGTIQSSQSDTGVIIEEPERTTVGTVLRVTPLINDETFITMVIEPEVSRVNVSSFNSNFQDPLRRAARTTVMVEDGDTVMLAGLIESQHTDSSRRIPGLGDIPFLGVPFKRTETDREDTEVLLFITPHIIKEPEKVQMALEREQVDFTSHEQRRLAATRSWTVKQRAIAETIENLTRR